MPPSFPHSPSSASRQAITAWALLLSLGTLVPSARGQTCHLCGGRGGDDTVEDRENPLTFIPTFARINEKNLAVAIENCHDLLDNMNFVIGLFTDRETANPDNDAIIEVSEPLTYDEACMSLQALSVYCGCEPHDPPCGVCADGETMDNPADTVSGFPLLGQSASGFNCQFYDQTFLPAFEGGTAECSTHLDPAVETCTCTGLPTMSPSSVPSFSPTITKMPSSAPSDSPSSSPTLSMMPSSAPSASPSSSPTVSMMPSGAPSASPSSSPTVSPMPSAAPSLSPTSFPTGSPSHKPSASPTKSPVPAPTSPCRVEPGLNCTAPGGVDCNNYNGGGAASVTVKYYYVPKNVGSETVTLTKLTTVRHGGAEEDLLPDVSDRELEPGKSITLVRSEDVDLTDVGKVYEATLRTTATNAMGTCSSGATEQSYIY